MASSSSSSAGFKSVAVDDGNFHYNETVPVETSQKDYRDFWTVPVGGVSNQRGPFTITIEPQVDRWIMANRMLLETVVSIEREDGTECHPLEDVVAPVDQLAYALWDKTGVQVNGHELDSQAAVHSNFKGVMEEQFCNTDDSRKTKMVTQFHHADSPGEFENMSVDEETMLKMIVRAGEQGRLRDLPQYPDNLALPGEEGYQAPNPAPANAVEQESHRSTLLRMRHAWMTNAVRNQMRANHDVNSRTVSSDMRVNHGFNVRFRLSSGSARINMVAPLCHDFFNMDNHIAPGNRIQIRLSRAPDALVLNSYMPRAYRLRLHEIKLHVHAIIRRERVPRPMVERYRYNETHMRTHAIPQGTSVYTWKVNYEGVMPKALIVGMVSTQAFYGAYHLNPFNFQHFGIKYLGLDIAGEEYPTTGLTFDFTQHPTPHAARAYRWIFDNSGAIGPGRGNLISYPGFETGQFLVPFDLSPDKCNGLHNHESRTGSININMRFERALAIPVTMVVECVYNRMLINDHNKGTVETVNVG